MVESDISERDKYLDNERQKYLIKSQIYGQYYCTELLKMDLPSFIEESINESVKKIQNILSKKVIFQSDLNQAFDLINDIPLSNLSFENRILIRQLSDILLYPEDDEFLFNNEIENIVDPYLKTKLRIYEYFKKSKYSKALELCDQILENKKLENYDKFILLGIKVRILGRIQDFKSADLFIDLALDSYEILSKTEKIKLKIENEKLDKFNFMNICNIDLDEFLTIKLSMFYIIKCFNLENDGFEKEALDLIQDILPFYSNSKCELSYADLLNEKGRKEYKLGYLKDALIDFEKVFIIYLKSNDMQRQKFIFNNLSHIFIDKEDWDRAIETIEKGINLSNNNDFNEILIVSESLLFYRMNRKTDALNVLKRLINQKNVYKSHNADVLFFLNVGLIMYFIISLELEEHNSLKILDEKITLLRQNDQYIRTEIDDLNHFIKNLIVSGLNKNDLIKNVSYVKEQLKMQDLPLLIKELL